MAKVSIWKIKQTLASYLNPLHAHFHHVFRLIFQDYNRTSLHASSPILNEFSSKQYPMNLGHGRGGVEVMFLKKISLNASF